MRIALLAHQEFKTGAAMPPVFAETLAKELATSVHSANTEEAPAQPAKQ